MAFGFGRSSPFALGSRGVDMTPEELLRLSNPHASVGEELRQQSMPAAITRDTGPMGGGTTVPRQGLLGKFQQWGSTPNKAGLTGSDVLMGLGALLSDLSNGGNSGMQTVMSLREHRGDQMRKQQQQAQAMEAFAALQANPNATQADYLKAFAPLMIQQGNFGGLSAAFKQPDEDFRTVPGLGVVRLTPDGPQPYELLVPEPPKGETVSPGWVVQPDGTWAPKKGGPYDPDYIARASGVRREAIVSRPLPQRARASSGGGGGGYSGLPPGYGPKGGR